MILLIEDKEILRFTLKISLSKKGYEENFEPLVGEIFNAR